MNNITVATRTVLTPIPPARMVVVIAAITTTIPYSLKNKTTNKDLPISTLNPLMSSLSPSSKSNGARLFSINEINSHSQAQKNKISTLARFLKKKNLFRDPKANKNVTIRATSKESLCKILRIAPNFENLLVTLHPESITPYALIPNRANNKILGYFTIIGLPYQGKMNTQLKMKRPSNTLGLVKNRLSCLLDKRISCFTKSLTPSIAG